MRLLISGSWVRAPRRATHFARIHCMCFAQAFHRASFHFHLQLRIQTGDTWNLIVFCVFKMNYIGSTDACIASWPLIDARQQFSQLWEALRWYSNLFSISLRGCSSVVEHSTADREVPGSNPGVPLPWFYKIYTSALSYRKASSDYRKARGHSSVSISARARSLSFFCCAPVKTWRKTESLHICRYVA
jgi:hypothetical protein